ncbi:MAG: hypothetical protein RLP12_13455 [Ekhidna sp.]
MNALKNHFLIGLISLSMVSISCSDDDVPPEENEEEVIDKVSLIFTRTDIIEAPLKFEGIDPDGEGTDPFELDEIVLKAGALYELDIILENTTSNENITEEVKEEAEEHMFFFEFTNGLFSNPSGNGNYDNRADDVNYGDEDKNGNPIGVFTFWTTSSNSAEGQFRLVLKHQPDIKSATSTSGDGETDIDIIWTININE